MLLTSTNGMEPPSLSSVLTRGRAAARRISPTLETLVTRATGWSGPDGLRPLAEPPAGSGLRPVMGEPGLPILGTAHQLFFSDQAYWFNRYYEESGPLRWIRMLGRPVVLVMGADEAREVYVNRDRVFESRGWSYFLEEIWGTPLISMDGREHIGQRRIMQAGFTRDQLAGYLAMMERPIERVLADLPTGRTIRFFPEIRRLALSIAAEVFVGMEANDPRIPTLNHAFLAAVNSTSGLVRKDLPGTRFRSGLRARTLLEDLFTEELARKRAVRTDDLFSVLAHSEDDDGNQFHDAEVVDHMAFLLMAAHDTSTATMTAAVHCLARHPEWQQRLRKESMAVTGRRHLTLEDQADLPTYDMVINEAQRWMAPLPMVPRVTSADTVIGNHFVPAETLVFVANRAIQSNPRWWPNPGEFDPTRFSDDPPHEVHPHAHLPFGHGAHKCIGMHFGLVEIKAVLHQLLTRYQLSVAPGYEMPIDWVSLPVPADGARVRLTPLQTTQGE